MDRKWFNFKYNSVKDKRIDYGEVKIHYVLCTIKDILNDFEVELQDNELQDLCYKIYEELKYKDNDDEILEKVKSELKLA